MTRARSLSQLANANAFTISGSNNVGIGSTIPDAKLDVGGDIVVGTAITIGSVSGIISATAFYGDGANLTGISASGLGTALSDDTTSPLNVFFKTPKQVNIAAGTSITVESDDTSGNTAFIRESIIYVGVGATFHVGSGTTLLTNVLGIF